MPNKKTTIKSLVEGEGLRKNGPIMGLDVHKDVIQSLVLFSTGPPQEIKAEQVSLSGCLPGNQNAIGNRLDLQVAEQQPVARHGLCYHPDIDADQQRGSDY